MTIQQFPEPSEMMEGALEIPSTIRAEELFERLEEAKRRIGPRPMPSLWERVTSKDAAAHASQIWALKKAELAAWSVYVEETLDLIATYMSVRSKDADLRGRAYLSALLGEQIANVGTATEYSIFTIWKTYEDSKQRFEVMSGLTAEQKAGRIENAGKRAAEGEDRVAATASAHLDIISSWLSDELKKPKLR